MGRVAVTGGSGKLGAACVVDLVEHGWDVVNLDRVAPERSPSMFVPVDLTDLGQVVEVLSAVDDRYVGVDAVVHLAAIPAPVADLDRVAVGEATALVMLGIATVVGVVALVPGLAPGFRPASLSRWNDVPTDRHDADLRAAKLVALEANRERLKA